MNKYTIREINGFTISTLPVLTSPGWDVHRCTIDIKEETIFSLKITIEIRECR
jgi:hypothetical protein